jgi:L-methionine (R)-S-oxide reductase
MPNYQVMLQEFESVSRSGDDVKSLMQQMAQRLHEEMARYNWVGFYLMEPPTFDALVLGPYSGSFMPTLRIPLNKGLCGAAATSARTVVANNVSEDPRYLGSDLVKANIVVPILARNQVIAELCIESYFADTFNHAEQAFIESCAAVVQNAIRNNELAR